MPEFTSISIDQTQRNWKLKEIIIPVNQLSFLCNSEIENLMRKTEIELVL